MWRGGGGGGGSFNNPVTSGNSVAKNWILGGGRGGGGLVVMRVKAKDKSILLQPMRGDAAYPMSIRSPLVTNGVSCVSFSWKNADVNVALRVQIAINGVDVTTVRSRTLSLSDGWVDVCEPICFSAMSAERRANGYIDIPLDVYAPVSALVRVIVEPALVARARNEAATGLDPLYGAISITDISVVDNRPTVIPWVAPTESSDAGCPAPVEIPVDWLSGNSSFEVREISSMAEVASDALEVLNAKAANGRLSVAECYVLGLDPQKETDDFRITSLPMNDDGTPDLENIVFEPPCEQWNVSGATWKLKGKANLSDKDWVDVPKEGNHSLRFFKVEVELP